MRLVSHIVTKDLRRLAGPVAVWLAFIWATSIALRLMPIPVAYQDTSSPAGEAMIEIWGIMALIVQMGFGFLLAGELVLQDAVVGSTSFWLTRPIALPRLLAAKTISAVTLFIVAPALGMVVLWHVAGATAGEVADSLYGFAFVQGVAVLFGLVFALLSRTLVQFLAGAAVVAAAWGLGTLLVGQLVSIHRDATGVYPNHVLPGGVVLVAAVVLAQRFMSRGRLWGWMIFAFGFAVCAGLKLNQPFRRESFSAAASFGIVRAETVAPVTRDRGARTMEARGSEPRGVDGTFRVPCEARVTNGAVNATGPADFRLAYEALARELAREPDAPRLPWRMIAPVSGSLPLAPQPGRMEGRYARVAMIGTTPLARGNTIVRGATRTRILAVDMTEKGEVRVVLEERDVRPQSSAWSWVQDVFVVAAPSEHRAIVIREQASTELAFNSLELRLRTLVISAEKLPQSSPSLSLVQIRFQTEQPLRLPNWSDESSP